MRSLIRVIDEAIEKITQLKVEKFTIIWDREGSDPSINFDKKFSDEFNS